MEALVLALIALRNSYRQQEALDSEPEEFQSSDLQELRHLSSSKDKSPSRLFDRQVVCGPGRILFADPPADDIRSIPTATKRAEWARVVVQKEARE